MIMSQVVVTTYYMKSGNKIVLRMPVDADTVLTKEELRSMRDELIKFKDCEDFKALNHDTAIFIPDMANVEALTIVLEEFPNGPTLSH